MLHQINLSLYREGTVAKFLFKKKLFKAFICCLSQRKKTPKAANKVLKNYKLLQHVKNKKYATRTLIFNKLKTNKVLETFKVQL